MSTTPKVKWVCDRIHELTGKKPTPYRRGYESGCPDCGQKLRIIDHDGKAQLVCTGNCEEQKIFDVLGNGDRQKDTPRETKDTASMSFTAYQDVNEIDSSDPWPDPLDEAAYHGLAGEIVRTIEPHSEADPVAVHVQLLVAFGNVIGRRAYFPVEADRHYGNLFVCLVGNTSKGRKGVSWGQASRPFQTIDEAWNRGRMMGGLSSGEGLIWAVRDASSKRQPIYEGKGKNKRIVDHEIVVDDEGEEDKRMMVVEEEFSAVTLIL